MKLHYTLNHYLISLHSDPDHRNEPPTSVDHDQIKYPVICEQVLINGISNSNFYLFVA